MVRQQKVKHVIIKKMGIVEATKKEKEKKYGWNGVIIYKKRG
jgi:hypothetical protein